MSNRNFDASIITHRNKNRALAQNVIRSQTNGISITSNPQNSNSSSSLIMQVSDGVPTTYSMGLSGFKNSEMGATDNITQHITVLPSTPSRNSNSGSVGFIPTTWINASGVGFSNTGKNVAYGGNGVWIAVGFDVSSNIKISIDNGTTWSNLLNPPSISYVYGIASDGNGNWVLVGNQLGVIGASTIYFSTDNGTTWNASANGFTNLQTGESTVGVNVIYNSGIWLALGIYKTSTGNERWVKIATTFDSLSGPLWMNVPTGLNNASLRFLTGNGAICAAYGLGRIIITGINNKYPSDNQITSMMYSDDNGASWNRPSNVFDGICNGIDTDGNGNWVAVGARFRSNLNLIKYSNDNGTSWNDTIISNSYIFSTGYTVKYVNLSSGGVWVIGGSGGSGNMMLYSTNNGISWTPITGNPLISVSCIKYANGRWIAVGYDDGIRIKYSVS